MSTHWDLHCSTCASDAGFRSRNDERTLAMFWQLTMFWQLRRLIAPVSELLFEANQRHPHGVLGVIDVTLGLSHDGDGGQEQVDWIAQHVDHDVVLKNEYGQTQAIPEDK